MYQWVQILSIVYIVRLGQTLLVHPRRLEIKLRQGNSQTYIEESKLDQTDLEILTRHLNDHMNWRGKRYNRIARVDPISGLLEWIQQRKTCR
jgi:hypothetical protein